MRIACPNCSAEYEVPASRLKPGKLVRCARCEGNWQPASVIDEVVPPPHQEVQSDDDKPEDEVEAVTPASAPELTAMERLAASPAAAPSRAGLIGAWVLTFVLLAGAVTAVIGWRDSVVRAWPPSGRILPTTGHTVPQSVPITGKKAE